MKNNIDPYKIKFAIFVLLASGLGSHLLQPFIHGNTDAINIIVTIFSILAGFLVAIIAIIGDPSSLPSGGWKRARLGSEILRARLTRHKLLFLLYLITLFLIFISVLVRNKIYFLDLWIERVYLFLSVSAFIFSFKLPSSLMKLHMERIEQEIKSRREAEGIIDDD